MKRAVSLCAFALVVATTGCATTSEPMAAHAPSPAESSRTIEQDDAYVRRVERIAMSRGIGVTWVNPPSRRKVRATN